MRCLLSIDDSDIFWRPLRTQLQAVLLDSFSLFVYLPSILVTFRCWVPHSIIFNWTRSSWNDVFSFFPKSKIFCVYRILTTFSNSLKISRWPKCVCKVKSYNFMKTLQYWTFVYILYNIDLNQILTLALYHSTIHPTWLLLPNRTAFLTPLKAKLIIFHAELSIRKQILFLLTSSSKSVNQASSFKNLAIKSLNQDLIVRFLNEEVWFTDDHSKKCH